MTVVAEHDPLMTPTIIRRVREGDIEVFERLVDRPQGDQVKALRVFWSVEHARRAMYAKGCFP